MKMLVQSLLFAGILGIASLGTAQAQSGPARPFSITPKFNSAAGIPTKPVFSAPAVGASPRSITSTFNNAATGAPPRRPPPSTSGGGGANGGFGKFAGPAGPRFTPGR
jgi:hypothetical protein